MLKQYRVTIFARLDMVRETNIPAAAIVGVVPCKHIHIRVDSHIINIAGAMGKNLHFGTVGAGAHDAAAKHGHFFTAAVNGIVETKVAHSNIDPAVNTHADAVSGMVGAALGQHVGIADMFYLWFCRSVGNTVVVFICENLQVHATGLTVGKNGVQYKHLIPHHQDDARIVYIGKVGVLVLIAVVVGIDQTDDAALTGVFSQ